MKVLMIVMNNVLRQIFSDEGLDVDVADAAGAEQAMRSEQYEAIVVADVATANVLRERWHDRELGIPIVALSHRSAEAEQVTCAPDEEENHQSCPCSPCNGSHDPVATEPLARLRAALQDVGLFAVEPEIQVGNLMINGHRRCVQRGDETISLSLREYQLLEYLARRAGKVVRRDELRRHVWGTEGAESNVLEVYIRYLRNKLGRDQTLIRTVRGDGYVLVPPSSLPELS